MGEGSEVLAVGKWCLGQEGVCPTGQSLQPVVPRRQNRGGNEDVTDVASGRCVRQIVELSVSELPFRGAYVLQEHWHSIAGQPIRHSAQAPGGGKSRVEVFPMRADRCAFSTECLGQSLRSEAAGAHLLTEDPFARAATLARIGETDPGAGSVDLIARAGDPGERATLFTLNAGTGVLTHCRIAAIADRTDRPLGVNRTVTATVCTRGCTAGIAPLAERLTGHLARAGPKPAAGKAGDRGAS
jgi:hypothetical protein